MTPQDAGKGLKVLQWLNRRTKGTGTALGKFRTGANKGVECVPPLITDAFPKWSPSKLLRHSQILLWG